jgi:hypothetical protein
MFTKILKRRKEKKLTFSQGMLAFSNRIPLEDNPFYAKDQELASGLKSILNKVFEVRMQRWWSMKRIILAIKKIIYWFFYDVLDNFFGGEIVPLHQIDCPKCGKRGRRKESWEVLAGLRDNCGFCDGQELYAITRRHLKDMRILWLCAGIILPILVKGCIERNIHNSID